MKKIIISLILAITVVSSVYAESLSPQVKYAIKLYANKNYIGALQTLQKITEKDPGNALAHYYLGMSYVQVGDKDKAIEEYNKAIVLSPRSPLAENANKGIDILNGKTPPPSLDKLIDPVVTPVKNFLSDDAKHKIQEKNINTIIDNVNNKRETDPDIYKRLDNFEPKKKSSSDKPTQEEIAEAMQVLTKAGINPANPYAAYMQAYQANPELMQMNMLMGGNNNNGNSMSNMMPLLMMMQSGQGSSNIDPQTMQIMMTQMMMPNMMSLYDNNNNNNY